MQDFEKLRKTYLEITKKAIKESFSEDILILQCFKSIKEVEKSINLLCAKLREWYAYYYPELEHETRNDERFVTKVIENSERKTTIGGNLKTTDINALIIFGKEIQSLIKHKEQLEQYLENLLKKTCSNTIILAGINITCLMLEQAGSLKNLAQMPASTIQLLGAEKALFRHLKGEGKSPKFGFLYEHELVRKSKNKGKVAKLLADKITIAIKVDYFKGKYVGDQLKKQVENRLK